MKNLENKGADLSTAKNELLLIVGDQKFNWPEQYITGLQVRNLVGAGEEVELFLAIKKPWEDELIKDNDRVDLARPGIERFFFKHILRFTLNEKKHKWYEQYITGEQLRALGEIPKTDQIYLEIAEPWKDELVKDEDRVDLARPSAERFYSKKKQDDELVVIKVNNIDRKIKKGVRTVKEIKEVGEVPLAHELEQLINGKLTPLTDDAKVEIKGGEQFFGHVRDGSSS
jgi:hypothetical protein